MLHDQYEDFNTDYKTTIFRARKRLIDGIDSTTLLPENQLCARSLLNSSQMEIVESIRQKRLAPVLSRFIPD